MDHVRVHCYGCPAVTSIDPRFPDDGLRAAGWCHVHGETYCPSCATTRGLPHPTESTQPVLVQPNLGAAPSPPGFAIQVPERGVGSSLNVNAEAVPSDGNATVFDGSIPNTAEQATARSTTFGSVVASREAALIQNLEEHARWIISTGVVWGGAGVLLSAGLAASPVGVIFSGAAMIGIMLASMWADRKERRGRREIILFVALMGFWLIAKPLASRWGTEQLGQALGWCGVLFGPLGVWGGFSLLRLAPAARESLNESTVDARLEIDVRNTGYGGLPQVSASLWPADTTTPPALAKFSPFYSAPRFTAVGQVPAKVYGAPINRAVVVASCPECVLVGRIRHSNFGKSVPRRRVSPLMVWLTKPRRVRLH